MTYNVLGGMVNLAQLKLLLHMYSSYFMMINPHYIDESRVVLWFLPHVVLASWAMFAKMVLVLMMKQIVSHYVVRYTYWVSFPHLKSNKLVKEHHGCRS